MPVSPGEYGCTSPAISTKPITHNPTRLPIMDNTPDSSRAAFDLEQVAAGFASALVTAQLIDEQMAEIHAATQRDIEKLAADAATGAGLAIDKAMVAGDSAV